MSYTIECTKLTQKYLSEVKGQDLSIDDILKRPHWKQVWFWWMALDHYEGKTLTKDMTMEECRNIYGE